MVVPPYMSMKTVLSRLEGVETGLIQSQSIGYEGVEADTSDFEDESSSDDGETQTDDGDY